MKQIYEGQVNGARIGSSGRARFCLAAVLLMIGALSGCGNSSAGSGASVQVVAAENQYGNIAAQIGGPNVHVTSLLNSPNVDPHQYEASASVARTLATAGVVIESGAGYDSWMDGILAASPSDGRLVLSVGNLLGRHAGDNPHIWYDPAGWTRISSALTADLVHVDPRHAGSYRARARTFDGSLQRVHRLITSIRAHAAGTRVTATEPVYGYMERALGFRIRNLDFQQAIMNENDPSPGSVVRFEHDLRSRAVRILFYNRQTGSPITENMRALATQNGVAVVGVTETMPTNISFQNWQIRQLKEVAKALRVSGV